MIGSGERHEERPPRLLTRAELREVDRRAIEAVNAVAARAHAGVFAVDLPSGLDCDTGEAPGACIRADLTATFVAMKTGFGRAEAAGWLGEVYVLDIGASQRSRVGRFLHQTSLRSRASTTAA